MALSWNLLSLFFSVNCLQEWTHTHAFNFDTHKVLRKNGEPGSLFGFSLAVHRQLNPDDKRILLVGAPRAKALAHQSANITGGLYSCEITMQPDDCDRVEIDNEVDLEVESKENQWMGVTVQSQGPGGKVMTCAHRYQRRYFVNTPQESRSITGRCYMLSEDLSISSDEDGGLWKFCEGRGTGYERFGFCQQGLSAVFTKDYHYTVFGAPGAYSWKGTVRVEQRNSTLLELGYFDDGPYEVGDENLQDPDLVPVPPNSYLGRLSYGLGVPGERFTDTVLGFSLDSGNDITKKGQLTIVAGAPRAGHSGAVVLLKKESELSLMLSEEFILEGPGLASSFGYDIAVVDLNGDGWQDIAVGAPQFFLKDGDVGGAVFIYINKDGKWDEVTPKSLYGPKDSMFGLAVENTGDITQDLYEDIAVGAPYDDDGAGKVYIYHGSSNGINTRPAQILEGRGHNIILFGYSLAGNMDLDINSYPDLAIGSLSDAVFVYRARPIISINKDIKTNPRKIDMAKKTCGNSICFTVDACFTYTAKPVSYSPKLTIAYSLKAESERKKQGLPPRVKFMKNTKADRDMQSSGTLELRGQNKKACVTAELRLQDDVQDKSRPIRIETAVSIQSIRRRKRQNSLPELLPVLNTSQPSKTITEVRFLREGCGTDNICQSNLQLHYKFFYKDPFRDELSQIPVENGIPVISITDQKDIALEVTVNNYNGEDAHEVKLVGRFPSALTYSGVRSHQRTMDNQVLCVANHNGSQTDCALGNTFKRDTENTFYILLNTADISLNTTEIEIYLQLTTTSEQKRLNPVKAKAKVVIELLLSLSGVARPSQLYFGGEPKEDSAITSEEEIGSLIEYQFRIINLGPLKSLGTASLNIQWPKENAAGRWMLYLVRINTNGLEDIHCTPEKEISPIKSVKLSPRKKREDIKTSSEGRFSLFTNKRKYKTVACDTEARCVEIRCPLQGLDSNAVIILRSRLWNSTFIKDYATLDYLNIIVKASLRLDALPQYNILQNAETQVRVTVFPERMVAQHAEALWWIILLGILAGLLMWAVLVFLLWKCGFFKRTNKDQQDETCDKAETHDQPSHREAQT